jgi:hypothetical protein
MDPPQNDAVKLRLSRRRDLELSVVAHLEACSDEPIEHSAVILSSTVSDRRHIAESNIDAADCCAGQFAQQRNPNPLLLAPREAMISGPHWRLYEEE